MKYTPPRKPVAPLNGVTPSTGVAKQQSAPAARLVCSSYTEAQCLEARLIMDELLEGAQVETKADYAAFLARVTAQHSYTGQEWHTMGTASQMWRGQRGNVRLRLAVKNLLTLDIESIYSIMGGDAAFKSA